MTENLPANPVLTVEALKAMKFRGPVRFYDGRKGMAQQDFECVDLPRFGYSWRRETRKDRGRQYFTVDGTEVKDLGEACRLLALPPDQNSPLELLKQMTEEFSESPQLAGRATSCLSDARYSASAGPFAMVRSWLGATDGAWHGGINAYSDAERAAGNDWPSWLYHTKSAFQEMGRGITLFKAEREKRTGLRCALGNACATCPILQVIESNMVASRTRPPFPRDIGDTDIDAAKVATCIGHILTSNHTTVVDGAFFTTKESRDDYY